MDNKTAATLRSESLNVAGLIIGIIVNVVIRAILSGIMAIINIIPILGQIVYLFIFLPISLALFIDLIFMIIGMARSKATLTEDGIYGNQYYFGSFDVTFDQITKITYKRKMIIITYKNKAGKKQKAKIYGIANARSFYKECKEQWEVRKA